MKTVFKAILLCLLGLYSSTTPAQQEILYQPEQMHTDLEKFKTSLIKIHPGTYTHQSPEEFDQLLNYLKLEAAGPMKATAFYKIVLRLIAGIHDGHTQAYTFGKLGSIINNQKWLPFQVYIQGERIFIIKDMSSQKIPEGSEILAIDGHLSNEIITEVLRHYSSDGKSSSGMYHWLGGPYKSFYRLYPEVFGEQKSHNVVYRDHKTKEIVTRRVDEVSKETYETIKAKKYPSKKLTEEAFDFEVNENGNYAYLKINRFIKDGFNEPENTYPNFYKKCFVEISNKNIQNLIVDLRDNGGGKASNAAYLLQYFIDKPITPAKEIYALGNDDYFLKLTGDSLNLDKSFGLIPMKNGRFRVTRTDVLRDLRTYDPIQEYGYTRRLIVLINGGTTSAAGIAAGLLKEHTNATLVGGETYGYAGISNGVRQISIKGNHTETAIHLPLLHAEYAMDEHIKKRSVVPDYYISKSAKDVLDGNDTILNFVTTKLLATKK